MQLKERNGTMDNYRPPQTCLNHFWTLTEGSDESRVDAATQLVKMIQSVENKGEREQITTYCVNRLVKGLGSSRKFARVGFSTALTLLLRVQSELKTKQVLTCFKETLKAKGKAFSKAEKAAVHLGHAFAISSVIQSGRVTELGEETLASIVDDLLMLSGKKSFLRPVCCKAVEDLIGFLPQKSFVDNVWPKIREKLVLGWSGCTLDRISLLLVCKEKFPDIVNKKFIKKHWGQSIFCEDNDEKLLQAIQTSTEKSSILKEKILPSILKSGRDALSIWKGIGEKMLITGDRIVQQQQMIALEFLSKLIELTSDPQQISALILNPAVAKALFMEYFSETSTLGKVLNSVLSNLCEKLKMGGGSVLEFVIKVLELECQEEDVDKTGKLSFIHSHNFGKVVNLMDKAETEKFVNILIEYVKGRDKNLFFSESVKKRKKQLDWCFRHLQSVSSSQQHTTPNIQRTVLALFLRNGYFKADKTNDKVLHCDFVDRFVETDEMKKLCESFLFKSLDQLSTMQTEQMSKSECISRYTDLLSYLVHYFQSLLSCQDVTLASTWSEETHGVWKQLLKRINSLEKGKNPSSEAFRLLYLYMALYLLTDVKTATDLLKDIFICHDKSASKEKTRKKTEEDGDPDWVEVLTEILLQLLSYQSHLARVISSMVFKMIVPHITPGALALITQNLIPNISQQNLMIVEEDEEVDDDDEDVDENGELLDENGQSEANDDGNGDNEDDDDENDDAEEEDENSEEEDEDKAMDVDDLFRASVKDVLGDAAAEDDSDDDDLPDLSDSEMFKFDEALAEVFRQRKKKSGGKKAREEKRKELGNFRLRVLDFVDVLIKSDRCGDFLLDLLKPLLVLMFSSTRSEEQAACNRAKASFRTLKTKRKGIKDSARSKEEQVDLFQELMDLAKSVNDASQLQQIASACVLMTKVTEVDCLQILQETLNNIIEKKQSKPLPSFFIALLDIDPVLFKPLCATLIDCLKSESAKTQCMSMACSLLMSMVKKGGNAQESNSEKDNSLMEQAAKTVCELILKFDRDSVRGLFVKELLTLTLALLGRTDVLSVNHFDVQIKQKLLDVKSKMGTDNKRLTNKIIAALDRISKLEGKTKAEKNGKDKSSKRKRKADEMESPSPKPKKKKKKNNDNVDDE